MSLPLRFELRLNENILFDGFLPETREDGILIRLNSERFICLLYMPNRQEQLNHSSYVPTSKEELRRWVSLRCKGLTLEIEDTRPDPEVIASIEKGEKTEKTEDYAKELYGLVAGIHTRVVDYLHNIDKQTWIEPLLPELRGYPKKVQWANGMSSPQIYLNNWSAKWLDDSGKWRWLEVGVQHVVIVAGREKGLGRESWTALGAL